MANNANKNLAKIAHFYCKNCEYITNNKFDYRKHILTRKHKDNSENANFMLTNANEKTQHDKCFKCELCGQKYLHKSSLSRHKKSCKKHDNLRENKIESEKHIVCQDQIGSQELIMHLLKENKEFKEMLLEQNNKMIECVKECKVVNNTNTTNNITNNNFNMQIFLNEKCANALNIMEFINQLQLKLTDLEAVGQLGYVEGISKIFVKGLKDLDVTKRPIHCSDLKREVMYIKDNNEWEKDNDCNEKMKKAIQIVANKNIKQIKEWQAEYPEFKDVKSKKNEQFMTIMNKSCGGLNKQEDEKNYKKIIKNVAKEVLIEK
jgi:hypothetical protein